MYVPHIFALRKRSSLTLSNSYREFQQLPPNFFWHHFPLIVVIVVVIVIILLVFFGVQIHRRYLGGGEEENNQLQYFFYVRIVIFWLLIWRGANKRLGREWGKGCTRMYIRGWYKPIFSVFLTWLLSNLKFPITMVCRSQWPRCLRRRSAAARLLRSWVRIPPAAWMFVCCECCVLSGRGLCDELITRPEESYWLWCVVVCDLETSRMRRPWPALGRSATAKKIIISIIIIICHKLSLW